MPARPRKRRGAVRTGGTSRGRLSGGLRLLCTLGARHARAALPPLRRRVPASVQSVACRRWARAPQALTCAATPQAAGVADEVAGGAKVAAEFLRPYVEAAAPVVEGAARETVKVATPLVQEGLKSAKRAAQSSGLDVDGAFQSAAAAAKATAPVAQEAASAAVSVTQALINGDPATLTTAAGVGAAVVLLSPLLLPLLARCDAMSRVALPACGSDALRSAARCAATPAT